MPADDKLGPAKAAVNDDVRRLHEMGYSQELARRLGTFSNFALSFSIICILAGGLSLRMGRDKAALRHILKAHRGRRNH